jgi:hypothetical protein
MEAGGRLSFVLGQRRGVTANPIREPYPVVSACPAILRGPSESRDDLREDFVSELLQTRR